MNNLIEIKPLEGLGEIKFGMSPREVCETMNEEQVFEGWMGGNRNDSLLYHGIIFGFDKCNSYGPLENSKLVEIFIHNREDILLFSRLLKDWTEKEFRIYCEQHQIIIDKNWTYSINIPQLGFDISFVEEDNSAYIEFWMLRTQK